MYPCVAYIQEEPESSVDQDQQLFESVNAVSWIRRVSLPGPFFGSLSLYRPWVQSFLVKEENREGWISVCEMGILT